MRVKESNPNTGEQVKKSVRLYAAKNPHGEMIIWERAFNK